MYINSIPDPRRRYVPIPRLQRERKKKKRKEKKERKKPGSPRLFRPFMVLATENMRHWLRRSRRSLRARPLLGCRLRLSADPSYLSPLGISGSLHPTRFRLKLAPRQEAFQKTVVAVVGAGRPRRILGSLDLGTCFAFAIDPSCQHHHLPLASVLRLAACGPQMPALPHAILIVGAVIQRSFGKE